MQEQILNGILHLLAIFAAQEGKTGDNSTRLVHNYLTRILSIQDPDVYIGLFEDLLDLYVLSDDSAAPRRGLDAIGARLDPTLSHEDKQFFLLQVLYLRQNLSAGAVGSDEMAKQIARHLHVPEEDFEACIEFVTAKESATGTTPGSAHCRRIQRDGWRDAVMVFHSPWTGRYFLRVLADDFSLDENPLESGRFYPLEPGAIIRDAVGQPLYLFEIEKLFNSETERPTILFKAEQVNFRFPGSDHGLHNLSFNETGGRLIGVMGGSGVGKSTLINILNGSLRPDSGRITVNGISLTDHPEQLEGVIGYVPQDDLLFEDLTVEQNLDFSARLCLAHLGPEERSQRVRRMLRELNQEEIAPLKVGNPLSKTISGGQRKRLNIALELIREPGILFVDEPTSGLSSADSDTVMGLLKAQASQGRLIIVIIHQPSSALFRLFDSLWVLDRGGYPIYMGHPLEATRHFREQAHIAGADKSICSNCGNVNPEQLFTIIEAKSIDEQGHFTRQRQYSPAFWHEAWQRVAPADNRAEPPSDPPPKSLTRPRWIGQFTTFFTRTLYARLANRGYLVINLLEPPLLALIVAWICRSIPGDAYTFGDNIYLHVYFLMAVIVAFFLGLSVSAEEIVRDRRILERERFLHLSWSAYSGAKVSYIVLLAVLQTAICAAIGVYLLKIPDFFVLLWMTLFSVAAFGGLLGLNVSAVFKTAITVYILIPLLLIPQMLLAGLIINFDDLRSRNAANAYPPLFGEFIASRWAFEALAVAQFRTNAYQRRFIEVDRQLSRLDYLRNDFIPALIGRLDAFYLDTATPKEREATRALIRNELSVLEKEQPRIKGLAAAAAALQPPNREGLENVKTSLRDLAKHLQSARQAWQQKRNEIHERLIAELGKEGLTAYVKQNSNRKISELVRNKALLAPYRIQGERIVRLSDPVYQEPGSPWGHAPFMSGEKRLGSYRISTYIFNLIILWIMNAVLALVLLVPKYKR